MQYRGLNCEFNIEWHSISSGGKPTFPTCEFPSLEWYPRVIPFFHSFGSWWIVQIRSTRVSLRNLRIPPTEETVSKKLKDATTLRGGVSRSLLTVNQPVFFFAEGAGGSFPKR